MDLKRATHVVFALTLIGIGFTGLIRDSFAPIWGPVPDAIPGRHALVYLCALVAIVTGAGLLLRRIQRNAAFAFLLYFSLWTIAFRFPAVIRHPLVEGPYQNLGENAVLIAAAAALWANSAQREEARMRLPGRDAALRSAQLIYGLALLAFGFSHFVYLNLTAPLVPQWLGWPVFWAYLTGGIYIATGLVLVTGFAASAAAALAAVQIMLITFLVWGPIVLRGNLTATNLGESIESWALTAGALVLASSFEAFSWVPRSRSATALPAKAQPSSR